MQPKTRGMPLYPKLMILLLIRSVNVTTQLLVEGLTPLGCQMMARNVELVHLQVKPIINMGSPQSVIMKALEVLKRLIYIR